MPKTRRWKQKAARTVPKRQNNDSEKRQKQCQNAVRTATDRRDGSMGLKKHIVTFRVTEEEYELLKNRTEQSGIRSGNISEYVRRQVLGEEYPYVREKLLRDMNYQIRKIGVNINQITARNNSRLYFVSDKEQLKEDMEELIKLFEEFRDKV